MDAKKAIYQAVEALVTETPLDRITVQNILDRAEVSRGTFYKYFRDKYDLANSYYEKHVTELITAKYQGNNWPEILEEILTFIQQNRHFFQQLRKSSTQGSFWEFLRQYTFDFYAGVCLKNKNQKMLSAADSKRIWFITGGNMEALGAWMDAGCDLSPAQMSRLIISMMPAELYVCEGSGPEEERSENNRIRT